MRHSNKSGSGCILKLSVAIILGVTAASVHADVIVVPDNWPTIQEAIDHASPGDTVLVLPGQYDENVTINVENLTVISTDGAGSTTILSLTPPAPDLPVVLIAADDVTLGAPGQGFAIRQTQPGPAAIPHSGNAAVMVDGSALGPGTVTIEGNRLRGTASDEGLLVYPAIAGGHLVIRDNLFEKATGASFGFTDAMYFHTTDFGGTVGLASLYHATVEVTDNTAVEFNHSGICFGGDVFRSVLTIAGESLAAVATPSGLTYGICFNRDITAITAATISNVTIDDVNYGVYVYNHVEYYSTLDIVDCALTNIHSYGMYIYEVAENGEVVIDPCTITGDGAASTGIYVDYGYYGGSLTIADNTISGFASEGIYLYDVGNDGNYIWVTGNTISDAADSIYVGYIAYEGGVALVDNNQLTGFTDAGMYVDYSVNYGGALFVSNNTMTAEAAGSTYGFYYDDYVNDGSYVELSTNTISGFNDTGVYFYDDVQYGSSVLVTGNTLTGDAAYEGIYFYYYIEEGGWVGVTDNTISGCDDGIDFDDYIEYGGFVTITGNTVTGFTNDAIDIYEMYEGCGLTIADNTVTGDGVSAASGINVDYVEYGSFATITGNTIGGFVYDGIYLYYVEASQITIDNNTITGLGGGSPSDTGIYIDDYVEYGSTLSASNNTIGGCYDGIYFDDYWEYGGEFTVNGNTITGFTDYGIYVYDIYEGIDATINDNVLVGGLYPICVDYTEYGSTLSINNNSITEVDGGGHGIYCYNAYDGCIVDICGNTVSAAVGGSGSGIAVDYVEWGSDMTVCSNDVSGFDYAFYLDDDIRNGSSLSVTNNSFDASLYGMYCGASNPDYPVITGGSICQIDQNTITGFSLDALHFDGMILQSLLMIDQNDFSSSGAIAGIRFGGAIDEGSDVGVQNNTISGFTSAGIHYADVRGYAWIVIADNIITGDGAAAGARFNIAVHQGSLAQVLSNCFQGVQDGVSVELILDTAGVAIHQNDFTETTVGVNNVYGDAAHIIDAEYNWWGSTDEPGTGGSVGVLGEVDYDPWLLEPSGVCDVLVGDVDGDGDVDIADLAALLGAYNTCVGHPNYNPDADFDDSGCIDLVDLATLLGSYGQGT